LSRIAAHEEERASPGEYQGGENGARKANINACKLTLKINKLEPHHPRILERRDVTVPMTFDKRLRRYQLKSLVRQRLSIPIGLHNLSIGDIHQEIEWFATDRRRNTEQHKISSSGPKFVSSHADDLREIRFCETS
jgi:hypothetical protein